MFSDLQPPRAAAVLIRQGIRVYSPIAHTHPIAIHGGIDPLDHKIWLPADAPFMHGAVGLIVSAMNSYYVFLKFAKLWELQRRR